jgi:hypothetical protein
VETAISLILEALQNRTKDSTARNATSSRSHAFVKLRLEQSPTSPDEQEIASTLFLVDLAGKHGTKPARVGSRRTHALLSFSETTPVSIVAKRIVGIGARTSAVSRRRWMDAYNGEEGTALVYAHNAIWRAAYVGNDLAAGP